MTSTRAERIRLTSPAAVCCAIPYLLGFRPEGSAVLLWLEGSDLILTQRIDLPTPEVDATVWAKAVGSHPVAGTTSTVIAALFPSHESTTAFGRLRELARALVDQGWAGRTQVVRALPDTWFNLLCDDATCCSPEGEPIDPRLRDAVAAEFAVQGCSPLRSRQAVVDALNPDPDLVEQVTGTGMLAGERGVGLSGQRREAWRDEMIAAMMAWARDRSASPEPHRLASLLLALRDTRVRDTVLWELARLRPRRVLAAAEQFARLLRSAPEGDVAPAATLACACFWLVGDGTRAGIAAERALDDAPEYLMAQVFDHALRNGSPPQVWRDAMAQLTRDDCRRPGVLDDIAS